MAAAAAPRATSRLSVRAISRMPAQPLALSFAPGRWMIEVAGETISCARSRAGDHRRRDQIRAGGAGRPRPRARRRTVSPFASRCLPGMGAGRRDHEGEGRVVPGVEVPPADQALVLAPPRRLLVLRPGDDARRAVLGRPPSGATALGLGRRPAPACRARSCRHSRRPACRRPTSTSVAVGLAADAVLRERDRLRRPTRRSARRRPSWPFAARLLPQLGEVGVPRGPRALRAVEDLAVRRERDHLDVGEAIGGRMPSR